MFFLLIFSLFSGFSAGIWAQNIEYAPHVTQINVEARSNLIRITWVDSPDAKGPVYIFRSARPFGGSVPANIRPVVVNYGEQYYIDDADDMENLYYFIAASDLRGQWYDNIIPRVNSASLIPGLINGNEDEERFYLASDSLPADSVSGIYNLKAVMEGERAVITFDSSGAAARNAILYRSTQPVQSPQDLLNAVIVQSGIVSPFVDFPVPGISWYYAIIFEDDIASGNMGIKPGINATVSAVTISGQDQERAIRPIPLPILTLRDTISGGLFIADIPNHTPLSAQTSETLRNTQIPVKAPLVLKNPRVFTVDLAAPAGGEDSALIQIVMEYFLKFEWETARVSLQHYLSLPRSKEIEARARFYLGQALYYTANYREALIVFLSFRSQYPDEANVWIDAVLTAMVY